MTESKGILNAENYETKALRHLDRQAGVSVIYDPDKDLLIYNAYCLELKTLKELFSRECACLDEALAIVNEEFGGFTLVELAVEEPERGGCSSACSHGCCRGKH